MKQSRFVYIILIFISFALNIFLPGDISSLFLYGLVSAGLISILLAVISYFKLDISESVLKNIIVRGQKIDFKVKVASKSRLTVCYLNPVFKINKTINKSDIVLISPVKKEVFLKYGVAYPHCGCFNVGLSHTIITDILGIITLKKAMGKRISVQVLPKIFDAPNLFRDIYSESEMMSAYKEKTLIPAEMAGVHDYIGNDNIKNIHWNLSSKQQKLLVKEFENDLAKNAQILLLSGGLAEETNKLDRYLEASVSLLNFFVRSGYQTKFKFSKYADKNVTTNSEVIKLTESLSNTETIVNSTLSIEDIDFTTEDFKVIISALLTPSQINRLLKFNFKNKHILFIYVGETLTTEEKHLMSELNIHHIDAYFIKEDAKYLDFSK